MSLPFGAPIARWTVRRLVGAAVELGGLLVIVQRLAGCAGG